MINHLSQDGAANDDQLLTGLHRQIRLAYSRQGIEEAHPSLTGAASSFPHHFTNRNRLIRSTRSSAT
jgi:hypothetical protein